MLVGMESGRNTEDEVMDEFTEENEVQDESANSPQPDVRLDDGGEMGQLQEDDDDDEEEIDITNPEDLARRGLQRIQIESEQEEFLLD